ncbi:hypothetical protein AB4084_17350, partial [Lysobacter sp. 2RAB21]
MAPCGARWFPGPVFRFCSLERKALATDAVIRADFPFPIPDSRFPIPELMRLVFAGTPDFAVPALRA